MEVFCFGPAQARLTGAPGDEARSVYNRRLDELIAAGVPVGTCVNAAKATGADEELLERGFNLEVARDAFLRFAMEGATVITF
ncbi:DsrE family protein [Nonomuraea sp. B12E4]|uniref:DsrE family protein n=1 Tax=Nonomuraea sp. B12E4 TaxID=3153564 RepID=UPI00325EB795